MESQNINSIIYFATVVIPIILFLFSCVGLIYKYRNVITGIYKKWVSNFYLSKSLNVVISLKSERDGLNKKYVDLLIEEINKHISTFNLNTVIRINNLSGYYNFKSREEAEKYLLNYPNIDLIIWGEFSPNDLKLDGKLLNDLDLKFTYRHPYDNEQRIGRYINDELKSAFANRQYWRIVEENSIQDISIMKRNLVESSFYILGLCLKLQGKLYESQIIFEHIKENIIKTIDPYAINVFLHLQNIYSLFIIEFSYFRRDYVETKKYSHKLLKIEPQAFHGLVGLALSDFFLGNIKSSEKCVSDLQRHYSNHAITWIDVAFYKILSKDYRGAFKQYQKVENINPNVNIQEHFDPLQVIEFLDEQYNESPTEPAFLYGAGLLHFLFADESLAKVYLHSFINQANRNVYKDMFINANKILSIIDS